MTEENKILSEWEILKEQWGLDGWEIRFSNGKRYLGHCKCSKKTISISRIYLASNPYPVMKDTLLHEIAHAVHFIRTGKTNHGKEWKQIAEKVGCTPKRCADLNEVIAPKGRYVGICPACSRETNFYRKIKRAYSCSMCSKKFDPKFELKIVRVEN